MRKTLKLSFIGLIGILLFFVWLGFFFPNPTMRSWSLWDTEKIIYLWAPRIFIPLFYAGIVFIFSTKNKKLAQNIGTMLVTLSIMGFIVVPLIFFLKAYSVKKTALEQYHPYLQLKPASTDFVGSQNGKNSVIIFCLGGSTTENRDSKGNGWTDRLQKELRLKYNNDSIYVYNFGRQWYTTLHTLINFEANLRHLKPDVIMVMHNINDLLQNADFSYLSFGHFREDYGHFLGPVVNIINSRYTGLFGRARTKFRTMWYYNFPKKTVIETDSFPGLTSYTRNLNTLIDLAMRDSIKVVLLSQPNVFSEKMDERTKDACTMVNYEAVGADEKWGFRTAYEGMKQYNERMKEISEKRKVYFIDLEKQVPKSLTYFTDEVHYTDTTFNIISKVIADEIMRLKIIK